MSCVSTVLHHAIRIELHHPIEEWRAECLKLTREERREVVPYLASIKARRELSKKLKTAQRIENLPHNGRLF